MADDPPAVPTESDNPNPQPTPRMQVVGRARPATAAEYKALPLLEEALNGGGLQIEELAREETGVACGTPGCVTCDLLVLIPFPSPRCLTICLCVEHRPPGKPPRFAVRASADPVPVQFHHALRVYAMQLWAQDKPMREKMREAANRAASGPRPPLGMN